MCRLAPHGVVRVGAGLGRGERWPGYVQTRPYMVLVRRVGAGQDMECLVEWMEQTRPYKAQVIGG
jgi:hypothetical protein